jgi:hypothetical protein
VKLQNVNLLSGQTGHSQSGGVVAQRKVVLVVNLGESSEVLLGDNRVVLRSEVSDNDLSNGEVGVVGLDDLSNPVVGNNASKLERRSVGLDGSISHASTLVGVERNEAIDSY